ncbi:MAG TPA: radical SAM protein [Ktedonobacteraceae bacterium]|jgi:oxygen-independent coproporphyrinogen-3 oxidase
MEYEHIRMHFNPQPTLLKFDRQLPTYNWLFPFCLDEHKVDDPLSVLPLIEPPSGRRTLYLHVPFCETICSFCPFTRGEFEHEDELDRYVRALVREMARKHAYRGFQAAPIDCIYIGGGTPSVLRVEHFYQLGEALRRYFDLSHLQEFTMECEVKSVTLDKVKAWQEIGVTRTSFGVQTFNPRYRRLFNITSTVDQVRTVARWVSERFPSTNIDMIFAIAGQTLDELLEDIDEARALGTTTMDYYTLNNGVAQLRMHRAFAEEGLASLSAHTRLSYRMFLNEYLRSVGWVPHNSYSFIRHSAQAGPARMVMQYEPVFHYQSIAYGYNEDTVDCYGAGAQGYYGSYLVSNIENREQYMARMLGESDLPWFAAYRNTPEANKGLVYFSYRGSLEKGRIDWSTVSPSVRAALDEAVQHGLAVEQQDRYELTEAGWLYAVNLMYLLMDEKYQAILSRNISRRDAQRDRQPDDVMFLPRRRTVVPVLSAN